MFTWMGMRFGKVHDDSVLRLENYAERKGYKGSNLETKTSKFSRVYKSSLLKNKTRSVTPPICCPIVELFGFTNPFVIIYFIIKFEDLYS